MLEMVQMGPQGDAPPTYEQGAHGCPCFPGHKICTYGSSGSTAAQGSRVPRSRNAAKAARCDAGEINPS